ncbi:unnamed protein product [Euphydryas editha]|uniref:Uncharacterized protein n=1 Tax=Euphydryas editha TaxID=104508 RepID=A0AAU9V3W3_EUPED|nr:unnamed protein product [Euphydryas editha]
MENSLGSTIEKIKFQEQDNEAKLKEKREFDATVVSLKKAIRETILQTEKSEQAQKSMSDKIGLLRTQIILEKIRRDSLAAQLCTLNKKLEDLQKQSNNGITKVWEQRSAFCQDIQTAADNYDVWALLMKPAYVEPFLQPVKKEEGTDIISNNEIRLQTAIVRRENALKERDRLKAEPDNGEEFLRIRNALRYSLEKIEELKQ